MGLFCAQCGERRLADDELTWRAQLGQVFSGLFSLDSRLLRTLASLVCKPGDLAVQYCRGARVRWVRPVQVFLLANVTYFLVQPWIDFSAFPATLKLQLERQPYSRWLRPVVAAHLERTGLSYEEYARLFDAAVANLARTLLFLLVPVTGALLHLIARRHGRKPIEALVLATHYIAAQLLVVHVLLLGLVYLAMRYGGLRYFEFAGLLVNLLLISLWILFAWRRFYRASWLRSSLAAVLVAFCWIPTLFGYRWTLFWVTYWLV